MQPVARAAAAATPAQTAICAPAPRLRHPFRVDEEQGIYRGEVRSILIAPADLTVDLRTILGYIEGDEGEEEAEDLPDP